MPTEKKEEVEGEIDLAQLYKKKGQKLRNSMAEVTEESKNRIKQKILELEEDFPLLPDSLKQYLLSIKAKVGLPKSLFPQKYFVKPRFRGKRDFFQRLATDALLFGLMEQRIAGKPFPSKENFAHLFLKNRQEWQCTKKDVFHALKILLQQDIIFMKDKLLYFEPLQLSKNINQVLIYAKDNQLESITIKVLQQKLDWTPEQIQSTLKIMEQNNLVLTDHDTVYFPFIGD